MKEALGKEKEVELAKEREVANMRLRDQIERYDSQMQVSLSVSVSISSSISVSVSVSISVSVSVSVSVSFSVSVSISISVSVCLAAWQEQRRRFDTQLEAERSRRSKAQSSERSRIEKEIASYKRLEDDRLKSLKVGHSLTHYATTTKPTMCPWMTPTLPSFASSTRDPLHRDCTARCTTRLHVWAFVPRLL